MNPPHAGVLPSNPVASPVHGSRIRAQPGLLTSEVASMKDQMDDIDEPLEDEDPVEEDDLEDAEPTEADLEAAVVPAEPAEPVDPAAAAEVESIQDLLVKQEARAEEEEAEDEDEAVVALTRDERLEPVETRVVPIQSTEFVCKNCFLVKHRSQLADKKRMLCRDCA
jgi:hypothetical protein